MGIDALLSRLNGVKTGHGRSTWNSRCPAHEDRSPSLSVRLVDDGRILLHCFAGCETESVLAAVGLGLTDLFPAPLTREYLPKIHRPFSADDALQCLTQEAAIVSIAASDITLGKSLSDVDAERVATAAGRIATALEVIRA